MSKMEDCFLFMEDDEIKKSSKRRKNKAATVIFLVTLVFSILGATLFVFLPDLINKNEKTNLKALPTSDDKPIQADIRLEQHWVKQKFFQLKAEEDVIPSHPALQDGPAIEEEYWPWLPDFLFASHDKDNEGQENHEEEGPLDPQLDQDEIESLKETTGNEPTDPNAVAFLVPLRGPHADLGIRIGRPLKKLLENETSLEVEDGSSLVLVRDSQADGDIARKLTQHFYEIHGAINFFGLFTDEESLTVAQWARAKAPGARFVSPTATSPFLDGVNNVFRVQPSASFLAQALTDLGFLLQVDTLIVSKASLHTDAIIRLLKKTGFKTAKVLRYYEWSNITATSERIRISWKDCRACPILLLGDMESWEILKLCEDRFRTTWILPLPTQTKEEIDIKSEVVTFMYRAYRKESTSNFHDNPRMSPIQSVIDASYEALKSKRKWIEGSYIVCAYVPINLRKQAIVLGEHKGWVPLLQYDIKGHGVVRRIYDEIQLTPESLKPLMPPNSNGTCDLIVRFTEELTGVAQLLTLFTNSTAVVVPVTDITQIHVDCIEQHTDLRCKPTDGTAVCQGTIKGANQTHRPCQEDTGIELRSSRGCMAQYAFTCDGDSSVGCVFPRICIGSSLSNFKYDCNGVQIV